ncbi:MAG: hypothetical protein ACOY0T_31245 [Myxococcota bacterium]
MDWYVDGAPKDWHVWYFARGDRSTDWDELRVRGLIRFHGLRGNGYMLTELGHELLELKKAARTPSSRKENVSTTLEQKQRDRFQLLKTFYELTDSSTGAYVEAEELQRASGLDNAAFEKAEGYLQGKGLIVGATLSALSLTHDGVVAYEEALKAAEGRGDESEYFPNAVVQQVVNQYFQAPVASVQTGDRAVANVRQNVGASVDELLELLTKVEEQIAQDDSPEAQTARGIVIAAKSELTKPSPNWEKVKRLGSSLADFVSGTAAGLLAAYLQKTLGF